MNEDLKFAFANVNDWLKFAEAKNGGLLALNVATLIGILQCDKSLFETYLPIRVLLIVAFCLSSAICVYSISPIVNITKLFNKLEIRKFNTDKHTLNYLFFGNIARLTPDQFQEVFLLRVPNVILTSSDKDLVGQIVQNSEIALQKFKIFNLAAWITFIGFIISMFTVVMIAMQ